MVNIDNIAVVEAYGFYDIVVEFSALPIESFVSEQQANDFIKGYLTRESFNDASEKGKLFKVLVEWDIDDGYTYRKLNDLSIATV